MLSEESVRRELAHYMKSELGMKVNLPNKQTQQTHKPNKQTTTTTTTTITAKKTQLNSKPSKQSNGIKLSSSSVTSHSSTSKTKNHKTRQRERRKLQRNKQKQPQSTASTTETTANTGDPATFVPSTNKNTLKNKRRREAKKRITTDSSSSTAETLDGVLNNTLIKKSTLSESEKKLAAQHMSEENAAKFKLIASSFDNESKWWTHPEATSTSSTSSLIPVQQTILLNRSTEAKISHYRDKAESLMSAFAASVSSSSGSLSHQDSRWLSTIMQTGTLTDKIAGLQLMIQDRCVGRLDLLSKLLNMAAKKGRRESLMAIDALKELFTLELIPQERKLKFFSHQSFFHSTTPTTTTATIPSDTTLMYWLFEDHLKHSYTTFLTICEEHLHDSMGYIKKHAINTLYNLLVALPEREQTIVTLLVNKLGDPDKKIASKIVYLLTEILRLHPSMKSAIVNEIATLVYRSGITDRAQYYGLIYLNQLKFHQDNEQDRVLAKKMIGIYFNIFYQHTKQQQQKNKSNNTAINSKLLGALLTGINRAVPYAKSMEGDPSLTLSADQYNILFTLVHTSSFNTSVQALLLLYQFIIDDTFSALASRFYRALYALLSSPSLLLPSSRLTLFLNLLYKSVKNDQQDKRICAMIKRMLQVCQSSTAPFVCGCLYLLSEVMQHHQCIKSMMVQGELKADEEEEHFTDAPEEQEDDHSNTTIHQNGTQNGTTTEPMEDDSDSEKNEFSTNGNVDSTAPISPISILSVTNRYDPHKRDPLYSNASNSCFWELTALCSHYHPSVISWSHHLLTTSPILYNGDPLVDFTLTAFLDRFVFKNPKKIDHKATHHQPHLTRAPSSRQAAAVSVSSAAFLNKNPDAIKEDEMFYYRYFSEKARREEMDLEQQQKVLMKKRMKMMDEDEEAAMDAFADQIMETELLQAGGGEPDADDDEALLEALEQQEEQDEEQPGQDEDEEDKEEEQQGNTSDISEEDIGDDEEESELSADLVDEEEADDVGDESDDDRELGLFDDEDDEDEEEDDVADVVSKKRKHSHQVSSSASVAGLGSGSVFASADEFADLLNEGVSADQLHPKELARERSHNNAVDFGGRRKHRQRGKRRAKGPSNKTR